MESKANFFFVAQLRRKLHPKSVQELSVNRRVASCRIQNDTYTSESYRKQTMAINCPYYYTLKSYMI